MNTIIIFAAYSVGLSIAFLADSFDLHPAYAYTTGFIIALIAGFCVITLEK